METYHFRNLVFEGGGVKAIAYAGALEALHKRLILQQIAFCGGTSAGSIPALLLALGYTLEEIQHTLWETDFNAFTESGTFLPKRLWRFFRDFGWNSGNPLGEWVQARIAAKTHNPHATFSDLAAEPRFRRLYLIGTNLSTRSSEIYSAEHTPNLPVAEAVRISMSLPFFFTVMRRIDRKKQEHLLVDGGILNNYPVKLFDRMHYVDSPAHQHITDYYTKQNRALKAKGNSRYVYNRQTLGFRLDSQEEINTFQDGTPPHHRIDGLASYSWALMQTLLEAQSSQHLHSDDWQRTIYIDTQGVKTQEFNLSDARKNALVEAGRNGVERYFLWYDAESSMPVNRPE
ncbi:MAG: patatin-like phospholipase family protein [Rickettsiales bacterium]|nr:patatin-like phospholipase family protein [Rickettsiales bacterium]